ncbi:MAG: glycosyltransferase family A protein, partial [Floccifex sp.]
FLSGLYRSILCQKHFDFEWIILDDGSCDNTEETVNKIIKDAPFPIRYYKQNNGGKHVAFNKGIEVAQGDWFICVDSDDPLVPDAIKNMDVCCAMVSESQGGFAGIFVTKQGKPLGRLLPRDIESDTIEIRDQMGYKEDRPEVYKTVLLKKYRFPVFPNEKFVPEAEIFDKLTLEHPLLYTNFPIQEKEYLAGGLTSKIVQIRINSINGTLHYYNNRFYNSKTLLYKIKALINYNRFLLHAKTRNMKILVRVKKKYIIMMPLGFCLYLKDKLSQKII